MTTPIFTNRLTAERYILAAATYSERRAKDLERWRRQQEEAQTRRRVATTEAIALILSFISPEHATKLAALIEAGDAYEIIAQLKQGGVR